MGMKKKQIVQFSVTFFLTSRGGKLLNSILCDWYPNNLASYHWTVSDESIGNKI